ncbi:MAG TPA: M20/M25/M40 family metallo-hydrolase, partial [Acidobacteriota bacterium]|nr:M20/M25/M40 family metallo-hydrolase [Acidobacteriota bacterium]
MKTLKFTRKLLVLVGLLHSAVGSIAAEALDLERMQRQATGWLAEYLRIDTANPPGNELEGALYLAELLRKEGIEPRLLEPAPARANLYARLNGDGSRRPLLLLHHMDVVPAEGNRWTHPPTSGHIGDGAIWGRGAVDAKGLGIAQLAVFLALKKSDTPLKRDVILLASADEEAGGRLGVEWLLNNYGSLFEDVEYVLTEGGGNISDKGKLLYVGVETAQKSPLWLRLTVRGQPGHGAVPREDSAVVRLIRALDRIVRFDPAIRLHPAVLRYFERIAPYQSEEARRHFENVADSVESSRIFRYLDPAQRSLLRNTISVTVLQGSAKTNVIASNAFAELDIRLLPDEDPEQFIRTLTDVIADPAVQLETLLRSESTFASEQAEFFDALRRVLQRTSPGAEVGPYVLPGFTDSRHFRARGVHAYGLNPFALEETEAMGVHGHDEHISI